MHHTYIVGTLGVRTINLLSILLLYVLVLARGFRDSLSVLTATRAQNIWAPLCCVIRDAGYAVPSESR